MVKVAVIGATGYTGVELVRLLCRHPDVELTVLTSQSYVGQPFWKVYPSLLRHVELECADAAPELVAAEAEVAFVALPHGHAMGVVAGLLERGCRVVDLGADFRFRSKQAYEHWYRVPHTAPELLPAAVYGLPEWYRERIRTASLVANPGCYPTGALLALLPLVKAGLVDPDGIVVDAKSGVSGAGRAATLTTHYGECNENLKPYGVPGHRHVPEMEQELSLAAGREVRLAFTPHLVPMTRGILCTVYVRPVRRLGAAEVLELYREAYRNEPFVRVLPEGMLPQTKAVAGSNYCDLAAAADPRTGRVILFSAIDNLVKGAAGQAVQNMNIMCRL
ncbi:MAG: N-acetyl-gamma-glutamyl-phosphate reductase, partial [Firmicutes bacterium]|nr:N-acetyl-gamma-glutamyl-phosphate reductase [Bacillota bacterium]